MIADVGTSDSNSKTINLSDQNPAININTCPSTVDGTNRIRLDYINSQDTWNVTQNGTEVTVTRTDSKNGWGLNLRFVCCEGGTDIFPTSGIIFIN